MVFEDVDTELYRLIPSRFPPVHVFEGLVANDRLEEVAAAECRTNPRLLAEDRLKETEGGSSHKLQNFNHAPFKYINPEGSVFFPPFRPALEMSDCRQTALAVAVARRERFLRRTSEPPIGLDMRLLKTPVKGRFVVLCDVDPETSREDRYEIGASIPVDADGVIFCPAERPTHRSYSVLRSAALGYTLQTSHFRFKWDGKSISAVYAFDDGRHLEPAKFCLAEDLLAA
jgi:hypothetical protein